VPPSLTRTVTAYASGCSHRWLRLSPFPPVSATSATPQHCRSDGVDLWRIAGVWRLGSATPAAWKAALAPPSRRIRYIRYAATSQVRGHDHVAEGVAVADSLSVRTRRRTAFGRQSFGRPRVLPGRAIRRLPAHCPPTKSLVGLCSPAVPSLSTDRPEQARGAPPRPARGCSSCRSAAKPPCDKTRREAAPSSCPGSHRQQQPPPIFPKRRDPASPASPPPLNPTLTSPNAGDADRLFCVTPASPASPRDAGLRHR
jgi:hypothetical protein